MSSPMWRILRRHRSPARRSRGQALVELALVMPIFLLLIAGAIDLGRLFYAYVAIVNASKEGALYGASNPMCDRESGQCPNPLNVVWHVQSEAGNLRDANGSLPTPTVACLGPGGPVSLRDCADGYTYRVAIDFQFRLITPILGSVLGGGLTLHAQSEATVLNRAFDPNPGLSVTKTVRNPKTGKYERTPTPDPVTGQPVYLEFSNGDPIQYQVDVVNSGGKTLTGLTVTDAPGGWPSSCPAWKKILSVGEHYRCNYTRTADSGGQEERQVSNTVTVDGLEISPVQDVAIVNVIADPPELAISKAVNVFRNDPPFGSETQLTVSENNQVNPLVWYRILVRNVGGLPATSFSIRDSLGTLPRDGDCPRPPSTLDPNETYTCFYSRTFANAGDFENTATADSRETSPVSARASVEVETCSGSSRVVPNLVEDPSGDPRTVAEARALWLSAGFSGPFSPATGFDNREVTGQSRNPFDCRVGSIGVTVGHR
jgi:TadE-like protein